MPDNKPIDNVISNIESETTFIQEIEGDTENVIISGLFDLEKFLNYIVELARKDEGYYSWSGLKYFLYEYELHLQEKANNNQKVSWTDFNKRKKEDTIEHIYPQTPNDECWKEAFRDNDKKQRRALLNSLGNLLLLAHSKNSELQNKCFDFKCNHKNKEGDSVGYFNGSYSEIEVSSCKQWTAKEIIERGKKMLEFMEQRWNFEFQGEIWDITKEAILNVDFTTVDKE